MKWKSTALGEVMRHRKGSITIDDTTSYKLCRVQLHRRGVVLRQNLNGAAISTKKQQLCKAGDFLVAEMDAKVGGYGFVPPELDGAIVSSHYYLFEVDAEKLHPEYLEVVSQAEILQQQIVAKGSTNYSSIRPGSVLEWKIPLPLDIEVQKQIARNFRSVQSKLAAVCEEITHQQSLLAKLNQAILQEAIQGKLTADWRAAHPDVEPASQLLHRIQAEKARLIAAKKLRPEKPLPKITPAEIPFEIPKGWEWCRLGATLDEKPRNGISLKPVDYETNAKTLKLSATSSGTFDGSQTKYLDLDVEADSYLWLRDGDILIQRANSLELVGTAAVYRGADSEFIYPDLMMKCRAAFSESTDYLHYVLSTRITRDYFKSKASGSAGNMPKVNQDTVTNTLIPLPPLAEQAAIVERVEALMTTCRALEAEIEHARTHAAHLLQAVLKEAFA